MTCIIAVERGDDTAVVGCDSFVGSDYQTNVTDRPKWHDSGCVRMLFAGSLRVPQVLASTIVFPKVTPHSVSEMLHESISSLRKVLEENGATNRDSDGDTQSAEIIFVCKGRVYVMQSDFSLVRFASGYVAGGAGSVVANGALAVMSHARRSSIRGVTAALKASAQHCQHVRGPYYVEII